ncbi:MAG TPA: hypothetical protein VFZ67_09095 [Nitrososphaera sp.]
MKTLGAATTTGSRMDGLGELRRRCYSRDDYREGDNNNYSKGRNLL